MAYTEEQVGRLGELLSLAEGQKRDGVLDYRAVPYLKEMERIVSEASDGCSDPSVISESFLVIRYLAEAYDRLGRFAVSAEYYKKAIELELKLSPDERSSSDVREEIVYRAIKARNFYVDDDCEDILPAARLLLGDGEAASLFASALVRRRSLVHDPVEMTKEYLSVIDEVEREIEERRTVFGHGSCHEVWSLKTELLAKRGIVWRSPAALNPRVHFD